MDSPASFQRRLSKKDIFQNFIVSPEFKRKEDPKKEHFEINLIDPKLNEVLNILEKNFQSNQDREIINEYLKTLDGLVDLAKKNSDNYSVLLENISRVIKTERIAENRLLFHYGDPGDKFYFILKGKISVLVPSIEDEELGEDEYLIYLLKLKKAEEKELLILCERMNHDIFPVDLNDIYSHLARLQNKVGDLPNSPVKLSSYTENEDDKLTEKRYEMRHNILTMNQKNNLIFCNVAKTLLNDLLDLLYPKVKPATEYVSDLLPSYIPSRVAGPRKAIKIYKHKIVKIYEDGDKFGEIALQKISGKRTATLITNKECILGILDKLSFDKCLNDVIEKVKKSNLNALLKYSLFNKVNKTSFLRRIFESFICNKVNRNSVIINENDSKTNKIYFLKDGEFEIKTKRSLKEINSIIDYFGCTNSKEYIKLINSSGKIIFDLDIKNLEKIINEKQIYKLGIANNNEVIGFDDYIYNNKYLFTVTCISESGEYFTIEEEVITINYLVFV